MREYYRNEKAYQEAEMSMQPGCASASDARGGTRHAPPAGQPKRTGGKPLAGKNSGRSGRGGRILKSLLALSALCLPLAAAPALADSIPISVNGSPVTLNPPPVERAGRVLVPLRGVFELLGAVRCVS